MEYSDLIQYGLIALIGLVILYALSAIQVNGYPLWKSIVDIIGAFISELRRQIFASTFTTIIFIIIILLLFPPVLSIFDGYLETAGLEFGSFEWWGGAYSAGLDYGKELVVEAWNYFKSDGGE